MSRQPIKDLPSDLVDQIAAGEVVERPASMVKELVENALDAESTHIRVAFQDGGVAELSVSDNGHGMLPADIAMSLRRHATSKIASLEDLMRVQSFGFRGEALASIASVSRTTISSRTELDESGMAISVHGGHHVHTAPIGMAQGTTVTARDLFYNVPVRRKFLKSTPTESAHIVDVVTALALVSPEVHMELHRDGRSAINLPAERDLGARAEQVFERRTLMHVSADRGPLQLAAWLCETGASHPRDLWIFVNARWVKDRVLARAVGDAMRDRLPVGTYPAGVVHVHIDPSLVDVNVHPQKTEVRFADPRAVYELLSRELSERLRHVAPSLPVPVISHADRTRSQAATAYNKPLPSPPAWQLREPVGVSTRAPTRIPARIPAPSLASERARALTSALPSPQPQSMRIPFYSKLRYVAPTGAGYIVCEGDDALYLMSPVAMRERVAARAGVSAEQTASHVARLSPIPDPVEVRALLDALDDCDFSLACVHPRPVLFRIGHDELAKRRGGR